MDGECILALHNVLQGGVSDAERQWQQLSDVVVKRQVDTVRLALG
jgi:hypothetical protein